MSPDVHRRPAMPAAAAHDPSAAPADVALAPLSRAQRDDVRRILEDTGVFREDEVAVALEVLDGYFDRPGQDYTAVGAFTPGGKLLGYVCYGPTPCTLGTWDLYWIAVAPDTQRTGVGTVLLSEVERRLARERARLVVIETSSQPIYEKTRRFYLRHGYPEVARVPDFYSEGDDRVIYAKRIQPSNGQER
jgi:ribosomal protein S18 acetylase RimI-like enzyme